MPPKKNKKRSKPSTSSPAVKIHEDATNENDPSTSASSENAALYRDRAKRWETNPFVAEWLSRGVAYCQTQKGKEEFCEWLHYKYPNAKDYEKRLEECLKPPDKYQHLYQEPNCGGHMRRWGLAAAELGVSVTGLETYHLFTAAFNIEAPERVKAPIKRRRGESAEMWTARLHEALIHGSKMGDMDWEEMRRIAISEYDNTRDTLEVWRTDPASFLRGWLERADSTVLGTAELEDARGDRDSTLVAKLVAAFRSRLHLMQVAHAHWYRAVNLFEELARRGLTTSSAVERAYQADAGLKWRLLAVYYTAQTYQSKHGSMVCQIVLQEPAFRPYARLLRDDRGVLRIDTVGRKNPVYGSIEAKVVKSFNGTTSITCAIEMMETHFEKHREDAKKFSSPVWNALGDSAIEEKFAYSFTKSPFGQRLERAADDVPHLSGHDQALFDREFVSISRRALSHFPYDPSPAFNQTAGAKACASLAGQVLGELWLHVVFNPLLVGKTLSFLARHIVACLRARNPSSGWTTFGDVPAADVAALATEPRTMRLLDATWREYDEFLWGCAHDIDPRPADRGLVARMFGLYDPTDPHRPVCSTADDIFGGTVPRIAATPAPAAPEEFVQTLPVAQPADGVQSGHAAARDAVALAPKEKAKTRGEAAPLDLDDVTVGYEDDSDGPAVEYPDVLPATFKLGKKNLNVFRQIMGYKEPTAAGEAQAKLGVVRWEQFEKAMKRIGFEVVQTAGSSVRFDPPAKTARPITFHRPHPEAVLGPYLMKWIGARLKRSYGWTGQTFEYDPTLTDPAS